MEIQKAIIVVWKKTANSKFNMKQFCEHCGVERVRKPANRYNKHTGVQEYYFESCQNLKCPVIKEDFRLSLAILFFILCLVLIMYFR